jgi:hypothetical protein
MSAVLVKDFNKSSKDMLTKNFQAGGAWKVESKLKPAQKEITINPVADTKSVVVNVEWADKSLGLTSKVAVSPDMTIVPTITYTKNGHKVESKLAKNFEVTYEGALAGLALYAKVNQKAVSDAVSYKVNDALTVGVSSDFSVAEKKISGYAVAVQYKMPVVSKPLVTLSTNFKKFDLSATAALPVIVKGKNVMGTVAASIDLAKFKASKEIAIDAAVESKCLFVPGATIKAKINNKLDAAIAYVVDTGAWKVALSSALSKKPQVGLLVTRE